MKQDGYIILINETDYDWHITRSFRLRMKAFCFPECIRKQSEAVAYMEWEEGTAPCSESLSAAVCYELAETESSFMLLAYEEGDKKDLRVYFENMSARGLKDKEFTSLGWVNQGTLRLILSRPEEGELHRLEICPDYSGDVQERPADCRDISPAEVRIDCQRASVSWMGVFTGIGSLDNLCLKDDCWWEDCEITLKGYPGEYIKCTLTLIIGGELTDSSFLENIYLNGDNEERLRIHIGKKTSLVLAGTLTSLSGMETTMDITLTGIGREQSVNEII